ncbi:MAG: SCO1664 family protein [Actinomycetes bacterium]
MELSPEFRDEVVRRGDLEVLGRMAWSSNATLLVNAALDGAEVRAIYKPVQGERPLWDFPDGTLAGREVAAHELSAFLGWDIVPFTVLRDGPFGPGMVQRFVDHDPDDHYFTLLERHLEDFRAFAVFDILANNTDRKAGHCLEERGTGRVYGIDHGLTFHSHPKLRTVIWDFGGEEIAEDLLVGVERVADDLAVAGSLAAALEPLIAPHEVRALGERAREVLAARHLPIAEEGYHSVPWPLV